MENYQDPARWPFFDQKTPRSLVGPRGQILPENERQPPIIESVVRILAQSQTAVSISYQPGSRPVDDKNNRMSYHITRGDSFHDKNYLDLGIVVTDPLVIYEEDSAKTKEAIQKFCKLANEIQAAQKSIESAWVNFLDLKNRDDLVQKTWAVPENVGPGHTVPAKPFKAKYKVAKGKVTKSPDNLVDALVEAVKGLHEDVKDQDENEIVHGLDSVVIDQVDKEPAKQVDKVD